MGKILESCELNRIIAERIFPPIRRKKVEIFPPLEVKWENRTLRKLLINIWGTSEKKWKIRI